MALNFPLVSLLLPFGMALSEEFLVSEEGGLSNTVRAAISMLGSARMASRSDSKLFLGESYILMDSVDSGGISIMIWG